MMRFSPPVRTKWVKALLMHHSSGRPVSGRVDASSKSAMTDPLSERSKSSSKNPGSAETERTESSGLETRWSARVVGAVTAENGGTWEIGGAEASSSRLSSSAVMPLM